MSIGFDETLPRRQLLITQRLRQRRCDLGLTQKQVVTRLARCGLRTTNRTLSSLEHGAGLEVAKLPALADALDCTVTYLVGLTDDPHRWEPDQPLDAQPRRAGSTPATASDVAAVHSWILGADVPDRGPHLSQVGHPSRPLRARATRPKGAR
jgi:transcriptional regulator with XRE-family HTH domain